MELKDKYGYKDYRISNEEIDFFIVYALNLSDYENVAEMISRYREYGEKPELRKYLILSTAHASSRIPSILRYVEYYSYGIDGVKILEDYLSEVETSAAQLKKILESDTLITPNSNPERYIEMLYSTMTIIDFHSNHQA